MQKCKIGLDLVCFELKTAKSAKSIGRASYAEAKKSAERSSKRRIELQKEGGISFTLRDSCVPFRLEAG